MKQNNLTQNVSQMHLVRAIACLGVVLTHARFVLWSGGQAYLAHSPMAGWSWYEFPAFFLDLVTSLGTPRVFFFFILSGFFLSYSTRKHFCLRAFVRNRFLRLYPAYLVATLLALGAFYVAIAYINPALTTGSPREFNVMLRSASADTTWAGLGHTLLFWRQGTPFAATLQFWSMLHEVVFCLLFPLYYRLSVRQRAALAGVVLVAGALSGAMLVQAQFYFLIGMLFYDSFSRGYSLPWPLPKWGYYIALAGLYLASYGAGKLGQHGLACACMVGFAWLLFNFVLTQPVRVPAVCVAISKASYAIYLNHMWALLLCYAVWSRLSGELIFYSRVPYYSGAVVAVLLSLPAYWLVDRRIGDYLGRLKVRPAAPARPARVRPVARPQELVLDPTPAFA